MYRLMRVPLYGLLISGLAMIAFLLLATGCAKNNNDFGAGSEWSVYLGDSYGSQYSKLDQVTRQNVNELEIAWEYHTGDADTASNSQMQANPLIIDGILYATSPRLKVIALDAASGELIWEFNSFPDTAEVESWLNVNRGVAYWRQGSDSRILFTAGSYLYALDAKTGKPVESFGDNGKISLKKGLDGRAEDLYVVATSPGVVYQDLIIIGSRVSEGDDAAPGDIRAFNIKSGELAWTFHTIPRPGEFGNDTWKNPEAWRETGGANSWAGMALDKKRGIVYAPTGSASPDFYGGNRKGRNLFANSLLALNASTGERLWHFQTVHHDLWDRDLPSPPNLVTVQHKGANIDAVAQATKTGFIYLFNRETGNPLFPIEEKSVPDSTALMGEEIWPTQPIPSAPEPFLRQTLNENELNPFVSSAVRDSLRLQLQGLKSGHLFEPPSLQGTLMFPGFDGGAEWGGSAFDPSDGYLFVNSNEVPWVMTMVPTEKNDEVSDSGTPFAAGSRAYRGYCMACHGPDRLGGGNIPALQEIGEKYTGNEILNLINNGRRMMPGFSHLSEARRKAIVNYLLDEVHFEIDWTTETAKKKEAADYSSPYVMSGYKKFRTPEGYPANSPPWGTLNAINLNTGEYVWRVPLGEYPDLAEKGVPPTGTENYGGPVVTAGGLVFIAATPDRKIRAFDKSHGKLLWEHELPAAGFATPAVYRANGRQYIVIACGGGKLGSRSGDSYVAFALPE